MKRSKNRQETPEERLLKEQNKSNRDEMAARHQEREKKRVRREREREREGERGREKPVHFGNKLTSTLINL